MPQISQVSQPMKLSQIRFDLPTQAKVDELRAAYWQTAAQGDQEGAKALLQQLGPEGPGAPPPGMDAIARTNAAEGMTGWQQFAAGAGSRIGEMARGAAQVSTLGLAERAYKSATGDDTPTALQTAQSEAQAVDAPLRDTGGGFLGGMAPDVAALIVGGLATRGTAVVDAFLPTTVPRAMAQGGAYGAMQPINADQTELDRMLNTVLGAGAGGLGQGVPRVLGWGPRASGRVISHFNGQGVENSAANTLRDMATDPAALQRTAPSAVPGVTRTLAEETLDPGISQLQRQFAQQLEAQYAQNNAARANAIRQEFRGADDMAISAIEAQRDAEARRALRGLKSTTAPAMQPVLGGVNRLLEKNKGRPVVQEALTYVKKVIEGGVDNADQAYKVRHTLNDLMEGRLAGDQASARAAKSELIVVRDLLDREMRKVVPTWGQYLKAYKAASREADQARVGQTLLTRGGPATPNPMTGEQNLTPATFNRLTADPNALVRTSTGFRKANASTLEPGQLALVQNLRDDLARVNAAQTSGRGVGSPTAQNLQTEAKKSLLQAAANMGTTAMGPGGNLLKALGGNVANARTAQIDQVMVRMLSDPAYARHLLNRLPPAQARLIEQQLARLSAPGSIIASRRETLPKQ